MKIKSRHQLLLLALSVETIRRASACMREDSRHAKSLELIGLLLLFGRKGSWALDAARGAVHPGIMPACQWDSGNDACKKPGEDFVIQYAISAQIRNGRPGMLWKRTAAKPHMWQCEEVTDDEVINQIKSCPTHYAFNTFFVLSGGSQSYAGSINSTTPTWTNTSSVVWVGTTTGTLTVTDSAASAVAAGQWINIGGSCVMQVSSVNAAAAPTYVITMTTTAGTFYGTEPTGQTYSSNGQVVSGGAWSSITHTLLTAATAIPGSTQINTNLAETLGGATTIQMVGTTTKPVWIRGYSVTPGDLDAGNGTALGLTYPLITGGANLLSFEAAYTTISGMSFTANRAGGSTAAITNLSSRFFFCRFASTSSNSAASAFTASTGAAFYHCYFVTPSTASQIATAAAASSWNYCWFAGAGSGTTQVGLSLSSTSIVDHCTFYQTGSHALTFGGSSVFNITFCTFYKPGGDSIRLNTAAPTAPDSTIANCYFYLSGTNGSGADIDNNTGTVTGNIAFTNNVSNVPASGHLLNFGDWPEFNPLSESINPFVSSTDLHLIPTSVGYGAAQPGQWENLTIGLTSKPDVGAWQTTASSGGGGGPIGQITGPRGIGSY